MTETLKNLKNENYEYVKYIQLVSTLVVNHQNIEKITVVKNKKSDTFILLIVNSRDEISTKRLVLDPAGGFFSDNGSVKIFLMLNLRFSTSDTEVIQMSKLNNEQLLTAYIANGFNLSRTAQKLNLCRQTVAKRVNSDEFQELLTVYRKNLFQQSSQILLENTLRASNALVKLLDSSNENVRLQSAVKILNLSCDYVTLDDLQQELNSLKEIINKE